VHNLSLYLEKFYDFFGDCKAFSRSSRTAALTEYCTRIAGASTMHPLISEIVATRLVFGVKSTTTPQITAIIETPNSE